MSYLIDTNVVSELRKPTRRSDGAVRRWFSQQRTTSLQLSVITVLELEVGIARLARRDTVQATRLRLWLEQDLLAVFAGRILGVDLAVARRAAGLHVPDPRPERDALIAATALTAGCTVVTRNVADFQPMGVAVINPWAT